MHYTQYWRITHSPFVISSRSRLYEGGTVEEAIARIRFVIKNQGAFGLLVGPSLVGKTALLRSLANQFSWSSTSTRVVYLSLLGLDLDSMLGTLIEKLSSNETIFQNTTALTRERRWILLEDAIRGVAATRKHVALFVDDTQHGASEIYAVVRRITASLIPITCVLSVTEDRLLDLPHGLIDRCQLRINLPAWDLGQTADYFEFSMDRCKGRDSIFDAQSITRIYELAEGLPYRINYLADLSLVAGALRRLDRVSANLVDDVASELSMHIGQPDLEMASFDPSEPV